VQFSATSDQFIQLRSRCSYQHPVLRHLLSLCSTRNVRDQVSHPYKVIGKKLVLCSLISTFLDSRKYKRLRNDYIWNSN
jgi:hypothetical protein